MKWNLKDFFKIFDGAISIEKTYKSCDKALDTLKNYSKNPDAFTGDKKAEFDETVQEAETMARRILDQKGQKSWPGVFREMHKNLAVMYLEMGRYDEARKECQEMTEYGEVGRTDSAEVMQQIADRESGKAEPSEQQPAS